MVVIFVQTTNVCLFLRTLQLAFHVTVFRAVMRLYRQAAVGPQLPLGAETVRCLNQCNEQSRPNRTNARNLAQEFPRFMFPALGQQLAARFLAQSLQRVKLMVKELGPTMHPRLRYLAQPFGTMSRSVDLLAGTGNAPTSVQRFQATHDPHEVFGDGEIAARELF